jgi:hypothetical protein
MGCANSCSKNLLVEEIDSSILKNQESMISQKKVRMKSNWVRHSPELIGDDAFDVTIAFDDSLEELTKASLEGLLD